MRHILMSYRWLKSSELSARYDWGELAADISIYCDTAFPKNSLENFVRGLQRTPSRGNQHSNANHRSATSMHRFSIPQPDRIEAIIRFLTEPDSKGYFCGREHLLADTDLQAPYFLQQYFDHGRQADEAQALDTVHQYFTCRYQWNDPQRPYDMSLKILSCLPNSALLVDLFKTTPADTVDGTYVPRLCANATVYAGWAVRRQQELLILVKHQRTQQTVLYLTLGYSGYSSHHTLPDHFVLLEHGMADPAWHPEAIATMRTTLADIKDNLLESLFTMSLDSSSPGQETK